ncbi:MAG: DOMON-like domain-containing protein [Alkalinema sp. RU_4_3]|nr:DOMON-like domain-containing protein [Alkalinema sp. RU_4_3]
MQSFELLPFGEAVAPVGLTVEIDRVGNRLNLRYCMTGDLSAVLIPEGKVGERCDRLWEHTCFEFFFGIPGEAHYWEVNLSPSGDWNCYGLTDYREGLMAEKQVKGFPVSVMRSEQMLQLKVAFDLKGLVPGAVELSVTAVVERLDGRTGYWAIVHTGLEADFHRRDSFVVQLEPG